MGSKTLVDLVSAIWGLASATISAVKNVASDPLGAIKAGLQFIANTILSVIYQSMAFALNKLIYAMMLTVASIYPSIIQISSTDPLILSDTGYNIKIHVKGTSNGLKFQFGDYIFELKSPLYNLKMGFETLSAADYSVVTGISSTYFATTLVGLLASNIMAEARYGVTASVATFFTSQLIGILPVLLYAHDELTGTTPNYDTIDALSILFTEVGLMLATERYLDDSGSNRATYMAGLIGFLSAPLLNLISARPEGSIMVDDSPSELFLIFTSSFGIVTILEDIIESDITALDRITRNSWKSWISVISISIPLVLSIVLQLMIRYL